MTVCPQCKQESQESLRLHHTTVWECPSSRCRLRFSAPQLDDTQLRAAYEKHYYPQSDNASVEIWDTRARHTRCGSFTAHPKNPPVEPPKPTDNIMAMCDADRFSPDDEKEHCSQKASQPTDGKVVPPVEKCQPTAQSLSDPRIEQFRKMCNSDIFKPGRDDFSIHLCGITFPPKP